MRVTVQAENLKQFKEAVLSKCSGVRYGSEFCEWKIPETESLEEAYELANDAGKKFSYVTPRISETSLRRTRAQLDLLDRKEEVGLVFNDLGVLSLLEHHLNLVPHLGRQLVFIPARCPWEQITNLEVGFMARRSVAEVFYQTSLNSSRTVQFYLERGVRNADLDWIPRCFQHYASLRQAGLDLSIHAYLTPVTSTRRCHTARFLGLEDPENCDRPCFEKGFRLKNQTLGIDFCLLGNTVFRYSEPRAKDMEKIRRLLHEFELVVTMDPVMNLEDRKGIDMLIDSLDAFR